MIRAIKGDKTIVTTLKMYRLIYEEQGYILADDVDSAQNEDRPTKELSEMSLSKLRALAKEKGIQGASKMKAPELIALLAPSPSTEDEEDGEDNEDNEDNTGGAASGNEAPPQS